MILGIDPGLRGAIAYYRPGAKDELTIVDMPTHQLMRGGKNKFELDPHALHKLLMPYKLSSVYLEQVNSMPGQGVSSVFAFGKTYGIIIGVLAANGLPYTFVTPQTWKKKLQVPASKDAARARASQLLPAHADKWKLVKHDGRAEAALIAYYGWLQERGVEWQSSSKAS